MNTKSRFHCAAVVAVLIGVLPLGTRANAGENVGTSQADLPNMIGKFVLHTEVSKPVNYSMRWGSEPWRDYTLLPGKMRSHTHALTGPNRAPKPYVRIGGKEYHVAWGSVGYTGFGPGGNVDNTVHHVFKYAADGHLDLFKRK
jgi:hypothetical protein